MNDKFGISPHLSGNIRVILPSGFAHLISQSQTLHKG